MPHEQHSVCLRSVHDDPTGANQFAGFSTQELVSAFQIPEGMHLIIHAIYINGTASSGNFAMHWDNAFSRQKQDRDDNSVLVTFGTHQWSDQAGDVLERDTIRWETGGAAEPIINLDIHVRNQLTIISEDGAVDISIIFSYDEGGMDFTAEIPDRQADLRSVGPQQTSPGQIWHKVGDELRVTPSG